MAGSSNSDLQRALGKVEGILEALIETVAQQGADAKTARARQYQATDQLAASVASIGNQVKTLESRIDKITPETEEFTRWRLRADGAGRLGKFLWATGGFVLAFASWVVGFWHWLAGKL